MARIDQGEGTELTTPSNDPTALSQQQLPIAPLNPITTTAGPSSTHHNIIEQGQSEEGTHHVVDQSYNCTANFGASGDQGQVFFLDPFGIHQYENTNYELGYSVSFTEQSQIFTQNPFGNQFSLGNYDPVSDNGGHQFSHGSSMT